VKPSDAACDVACFIYDLSDPRSFSYCAGVYKVAGRGPVGLHFAWQPCVSQGSVAYPSLGLLPVSTATLRGQPDPLRLRGLQDRPARSESAARALPRRVLLQALPPAALPLLLPRPGPAWHHHLHQAGHRRHLPVSIRTAEGALGWEQSLGRGLCPDPASARGVWFGFALALGVACWYRSLKHKGRCFPCPERVEGTRLSSALCVSLADLLATCCHRSFYFLSLG